MRPVLTLISKHIQEKGNIEKTDREYRCSRRKVLCFASLARYRGGYLESGWYYDHGSHF